MNPQELQVAQAAIAAPHSATYDAIHDIIAQATGMKKTRWKLSSGIWSGKVSFTSAGDPPPMLFGKQPPDPARGWYEKGSMWK